MLTQLNEKQLTNVITRSIIKGAFQNKTFFLNDTPSHLSIDHKDNQSVIIISGEADNPHSELFILDIDRTPYLHIDTKNREELRSAILKIYEKTKSLEYLTPDTVNDPFHKRLNIPDTVMVDFINKTVNESHNHINYQRDGRLLTNSLSNFDKDDHKKIVNYFLRSVITKGKLDDFLVEQKVDDAKLLSQGIRPLTQTPFYYDQFKNQLIEFFFNKDNPYFKDVFQNLIDKAEEELVSTVHYDFDSNEEEESTSQQLDDIAAKLDLIKKINENKRKYG
jgi:hypothetical protein